MSAPAMLRVCCVCKRVYGTTPCAPELAGMETHGYCPEHAVAALADAEEFFRFNFGDNTETSEAPASGVTPVNSASTNTLSREAGKRSAGNKRSAPEETLISNAAPATTGLARFDSIMLAELAFVCGLEESKLRLIFSVIGWRIGEQWEIDASGDERVHDWALPSLEGHLATTGERDAATRLLLWVSRANEQSSPPRRKREPWYQQEAFA